jgi:transcriptional regulator with XRE-family HTH domain
VSHLKLKIDECSPLGKLLLAYVQRNPGVNLSKLAKEMGLSRPGLGWVCLKHTSPNEETSAKIAAVLGLKEKEAAQLVHQNKLDNLTLPNWIDKEAVAESLDELFATLRRSEHHLYPETSRRSDFQIYKQAFEVLKARLEEAFDQIVSTVSSSRVP